MTKLPIPPLRCMCVCAHTHTVFLRETKIAKKLQNMQNGKEGQKNEGTQKQEA